MATTTLLTGTTSHTFDTTVGASAVLASSGAGAFGGCHVILSYALASDPTRFTRFRDSKFSEDFALRVDPVPGTKLKVDLIAGASGLFTGADIDIDYTEL